MYRKSFFFWAFGMLLLAACDIRHVAVGEWDITVELPGGEQRGHWSVGDDDRIAVRLFASNLTTDAELVGSRLIWAGEIGDWEDKRSSQRVSFSGTINGNSLAGTLYTTRGNFWVNGSRQ